MASTQPVTTTGAFFRCPGCGELIEAALIIDPQVDGDGSCVIHMTPKILGVGIEHYCGQAKRGAE